MSWRLCTENWKVKEIFMLPRFTLKFLGKSGGNSASPRFINQNFPQKKVRPFILDISIGIHKSFAFWVESRSLCRRISSGLSPQSHVSLLHKLLLSQQQKNLHLNSLFSFAPFVSNFWIFKSFSPFFYFRPLSSILITHAYAFAILSRGPNTLYPNTLQGAVKVSGLLLWKYSSESLHQTV